MLKNALFFVRAMVWRMVFGKTFGGGLSRRDVAFLEDQSRKRDNNAAQNFSVLTKIALNLLKNEKTAKVGVKGKRLKAGWDNQYLEKLIRL